jgi:NAD(P)-dependent dehydrogenase (short-subunit alcohol dehydrogenase family)
MTTPFSLEDRTVLITGASAGLGAHFARTCAAAGARVVLAARRADRVAALAEELGGGARALAVTVDVNDEASIVAAYDAAEAAFGPVDSIVANAGISAAGRSTDVTAADVAGVMATNFTGVFLTAREGAKRLMASGAREDGRGRILIIGSITAELTAQGDAAYAASKAAVAHLTRQFAREWVRQGINVNAIQPGYIRSELAGEWFDSEGGQAQINAFHRRRLQSVRSLEPMLLYFLSDASAETTGTVMTVDDGQSL